jgi:RND superfamily putative drug exporter
VYASLARLIHRNARATLVLAGLFLASAIGVLVRGGELRPASIEGLESGRAGELVGAVLGHPSETTFVVIFRDRELDPGSAGFRDAMRRALAGVRSDPRVLSVETPDAMPPEALRSMTNPARHAALAFVTLRGSLDEALAAYREVRAELRSDRLEITCTGHVPYTHDLDVTLERDLLRAEMVSLPLSLVVLLWVFRTLVAALVPVGVGALAVMGGIALILGVSRHADMAQYTVNVCSVVGLGVAIDYSLFTVSRYREELAAGHGYEEALVRAMSVAGRMVAFSGLAVVAGFGGLFFFEGSYLFAMGLGGAIVVTLAVVFALTFLPALLVVLGPHVHGGRLPGRLATAPSVGGRWARLATGVMRHPILVLVPTLAILLGMGSPFLRLRVGTADVRVLPDDVEARRGYEELREDFPALAATRLTVAVEFPTPPALTRDRVGALYDLSRHIATLPGVSRVESVVDGVQPDPGRAAYQTLLLAPELSGPGPARAIAAARRATVGDRVVLLYVLTDESPYSERARTLVRELRARRAVADGALVVGGQPAADVDTTRYVVTRAPRAIAFVVGVTVVLLFLLLGSVLLPLKAVAMNFLSIAGSFGALVWVFQEGHLFVRDARPIEPSVPVVLFCALFGLSMDYEVLMLSRMKEAFERTRDNTRAVAEGLEKTAGLITSAAAIMVVVFTAFATARVVILQAVGAGMALAVAIDATLIRVLLVPSMMRLFGDANWWAPGPLLRFRRRLGIRHRARR